MFTPKLHILPPAQRRLWEDLEQTPKEFVLYGGTALALRLGHRHSEDFDFFSNISFAPESFRRRIPYLETAEITQLAANTLTAIVDRDGPVKVSFFGALALNRVHDPDVTEDNGIQVASLLDVAATKVATIQQRAQAKDYEDVAVILTAGVSLAEAMAAATAVYGGTFNGALSLKALTYFSDGDLPNLNETTQKKLRELAGQVKLREIPRMEPRLGVSLDRSVSR
jgi:hypothetical protein